MKNVIFVLILKKTKKYGFIGYRLWEKRRRIQKQKKKQINKKIKK